MFFGFFFCCAKDLCLFMASCLGLPHFPPPRAQPALKCILNIPLMICPPQCQHHKKNQVVTNLMALVHEGCGRMQKWTYFRFIATESLKNQWGERGESLQWLYAPLNVIQVWNARSSPAKEMIIAELMSGCDCTGTCSSCSFFRQNYLLEIFHPFRDWCFCSV